MEREAYLLSRFRLARCRLEELYRVIDPNQKPDPKVVENALRNLPNEITELYDNAVEYISSIGNAKMALQWLMCAVRPLKISELAELMDWRQTAKSDHRSIRKTFGSLISVSRGAEDDNNAPVELAHFTVREYLSAERAPHNIFRGGEYEAHLTVAHHCIEYLSYYYSEFPDGAHGTEADQVVLNKRPLLEYAINNWYRHALASLEKIPLADSSRKALIDGGGNSDPALTKSLLDMAGMNTRLGELTSSFLQRLYRAYSEWETSLMTMLAVSPPTERKTMTTTSSGLRGLSRTNTFVSTRGLQNLSSINTFSGWVESTKNLLESSHPDLNEYRSSVKKAAYRGYEFMVDLLLELGASANARSPHYDVLTAASTDRYHLMIMLLLEKEVGESYGNTWWPEESALEVKTDGTSIVRTLLLAGADVAISSSMGETTLHQVAANGKVGIARLLLSRHAETEQQCSGNGIVVFIREKKVSWRWKCKGTPLHWAVSKSHHNIVRLLLDESANMSATLDRTGQTAIHLAARDSDVGMIQLLLDRGADIEAKDGAGISALQFASYSGKLGIVKCLLENGADVHVCASDGSTPLQIASLQGHKDVVTELLSQGVGVDIAEEDGFTALYMAAQEGHGEVVQILLNSGAQTEATSRYGSTALAATSWKGDVGCIRNLLDHGAKIDARKDSGQTALSLVAERGHVDAATLLLDRKTDVTLRSTIWGPILNAAAYGGIDVVFQACVDRGANLQEKDVYGRTLIHFAAAGGKADMISTVVSLGLSAHTKDRQGRNALHFAAASKSVAAVTKILEQGVDYRLEDNDGWTPLHWAVKAGDELVVKFLLEAGPVEGSVKWTPAKIAALHGHTGLLPILKAKTSSAAGALVENTNDTEPQGYKHESIRCDGCLLVCQFLICLSKFIAS
jgi:ankyrin repeat protein